LRHTLAQTEEAASSERPLAPSVGGDLEGCIHIMMCGYAALAASDYAAAAVHFTSLTGLLPDNLHALLCAAQALAGKGDTSAALGGPP
jgi:hypothetical protein